MKDSVHSVTFKANVAVGENGVTAESNNFNINRTLWGVSYGSTIMGTAKDKAINDEMGLQIKLVGDAAAENAGGDTAPEGETPEEGDEG